MAIIHFPLLRLIIAAGISGIASIVKDFVSNHSEISKRQCEIKIGEIAEKEKRAGDTTKVWHLKPEFEYLLNNKSTNSAKEATDSSQKKKSTPGEKRKREDDKTPPVTPATKKKAVIPSSSASVSLEKTPVAVSVGTSGDVLVPPRKYKRAFGHFVRIKRSEVEELMKNERLPSGADEVFTMISCVCT